MSNDVSPVANQPATPAVVDEQSQPNPTGTGSGTLTSDSEVKNLEEFKKKAPEVYDKMMLSIATEICNKMKASQERLKQMWRDATERARG